MKPSRKSLLLPIADGWLLTKAALLLGAIKLGTRLLPFRILQSLVTQAAGMQAMRKRLRTDRASADMVAWAVETASRYTPRAKGCLIKAFAAQVLLNRRGHPALLHIGVAREEQGQFRAHAWVESEGKVVIGGAGLEPFTPLAVLEGKALESFDRSPQLGRSNIEEASY
jgi:hypothetical protein